MNGPTLQEGRVEVCFNNTYGSICHDLWNENDAQVVCRELGFSDEGASALSNAYYNSSSGPIYLDNVQCEGDEASLQSCAQNQEVDDCTHSEDAGVRCLGMLQLQVYELYILVSGTASQMTLNNLCFSSHCSNLPGERSPVAGRPSR